jgi:RNA polymerase sigma-70 factor (TIGR02943 family)
MVIPPLQPEKWVLLYGDFLYTLAFLKVGNKDIAQDIVQDTFLSAIRAKETFKGHSNEKTWLTVILRNKVIDYYRKKDILKDADDYLGKTDDSFHEIFFERDVESYGHWLESTAPKNWTEQADQSVTRKEFYQVLSYCIGKMPTKLVPAFIAKYIDEEDSEKICKELDISSSNYWVMIHRAKVLMRSCLEKNWFSQ